MSVHYKYLKWKEQYISTNRKLMYKIHKFDIISFRFVQINSTSRETDLSSLPLLFYRIMLINLQRCKQKTFLLKMVHVEENYIFPLRLDMANLMNLNRNSNLLEVPSSMEGVCDIHSDVFPLITCSFTFYSFLK